MPRAIATFASAWSSSARRTTQPIPGSRTTQRSPAAANENASMGTLGTTSGVSRTPRADSAVIARMPMAPAQNLSRG